MIVQVRISAKNSKLGNIPSFSLPSISACPGATSECKKICYAAKIERIYKNAAKAYEINMAAIDDPAFVPTLAAEITNLVKKKHTDTFRWNVSGDITNIKYLLNMKQIMMHFPNITFYAYTRNWALPNWIPHLENIKKLANFTLLASMDDEHLTKNMFPPPEWRIAYVGNKTVSEFAALVNKKVIVCPNQANKTKAILCDKCNYCFNPKLLATTNSVYFIKH